MSKQDRLLELGAMTEMYRQGSSLAEVGERFQITRQAVYARLKPIGVLRSKIEAKALVREREVKRGMAKGDDIQAALEGGESPTAVSNRLGILPAVTKVFYDQMEPLKQREMRYKGGDSVYNDTQLTDALILVAEVHNRTPGVTLYSRYRESFPELLLPHAMTIVKRFSGWARACEAAGLTPNSRPPAGTGEPSYTLDQIDAAVKLVGECVRGLPSIGDYKDFIEANSWKHPNTGTRLPSPGTVMREYNGWLNALKANFEDITSA